MDCTDCSIKYNILRIQADEIALLKAFYEDGFGMVYSEEKTYEHPRHIFKFPNQENATALCFEVREDNNDGFKFPQNAGYWKVGVGLHDVAAAVKHMKSVLNIDVCDPVQFFNICYATHLKDPVGYSIEFLQHTFENNFKPALESEKSLLGQPKSLPPCISQITLDIKEPGRTCTFYSNVLGMRLMAVLPCAAKKFTLYFFAFTNLSYAQQSDDSKAEWLWKQSFCQIEFRHQHGKENIEGFLYTTNDKQKVIGHGGYCINVPRKKYDYMKCQTHCKEDIKGRRMSMCDPDGYKIEVMCNEDNEPN